MASARCALWQGAEPKMTDYMRKLTGKVVFAHINSEITKVMKSSSVQRMKPSPINVKMLNGLHLRRDFLIFPA